MKKILMTGCLLFINLFINTAFAESSVWKITKGNNYFYLGGTIHLLTRDDHPLPIEFEMAYQDATKIIFETDLLATQSDEFQQKLMSVMTYSDQRTLASELSPTMYRKLDAFMKTRNMNIDHYAGFQPWATALMLTMMEYQRLGMSPDYGVDNYFNRKALADNKKITGLETPDEQLGFIASMAESDPDMGIEYTLKDLERLPDFIEWMKNSWRSGALNEFDKSPYMMTMKAEFPEVYNNLVLKRNNNWMQKIPAMIKAPSQAFILVGAMHLSGDEGLLNQLKHQGFIVEQLKPGNNR